jgi:PAS domain-containing protein
MRQWELIGITDSDPSFAPIRKVPVGVVSGGTAESSTIFFWSTDVTLRLRTVSEAACEALGLPVEWVEGRDLVDVFSEVGPDLAAIEAHANALSGEDATFTLRGAEGGVRCRVAPMHDGDGQVIGTFCLATPESVVEVEGRVLATAAA